MAPERDGCRENFSRDEELPNLADAQTLPPEGLDLLDALEDAFVVEAMPRWGPLGLADEPVRRVVVEGLAIEPRVAHELTDLVELSWRDHVRSLLRERTVATGRILDARRMGLHVSMPESSDSLALYPPGPGRNLSEM